MWGSEFFNETLIFLLLLFDVRKQLVIRKKKLFYFSRLYMLRKCHITICFRSGTSFWAILGLFLPFSPTNNPKETFEKIKIILHMCVNSHGHRM